jgi:hypothetical protein
MSATCPRIAGLYPRGDSGRKSPDRERDALKPQAERYFSPVARFAVSSIVMQPSAAENVRSASDSAGRTQDIFSGDALLLAP